MGHQANEQIHILNEELKNLRKEMERGDALVAELEKEQKQRNFEKLNEKMKLTLNVTMQRNEELQKEVDVLKKCESAIRKEIEEVRVKNEALGQERENLHKTVQET